MSKWQIEYKPARGKGVWCDFTVQADKRAEAIQKAAWIARIQCPGYVMVRAVELSERPVETAETE